MIAIATFAIHTMRVSHWTKRLDGQRLHDLDFHRNVHTLSLLFPCQVIQSLKAKHPPTPILHEYHIIRNLLTDMFFVGIIEPNRQRIAGAVMVHP